MTDKIDALQGLASDMRNTAKGWGGDASIQWVRDCVFSWAKRASALAEQPAAPSDLDGGIDGEWYCESHPEHLMGHDDCGGAGIPACSRIPLLLNTIRLLRQEVRERDFQYGHLAQAALNDEQPQRLPNPRSASEIAEVAEEMMTLIEGDPGDGTITCDTVEHWAKRLIDASTCAAEQPAGAVGAGTDYERGYWAGRARERELATAPSAASVDVEALRDDVRWLQEGTRLLRSAGATQTTVKMQLAVDRLRAMIDSAGGAKGSCHE